MLISLFFSLFIPITLGYLSLCLIFFRHEFRFGSLFLWVLSFGIGMAMLPQGIIFLNWIKIPLTLVNMTAFFASLLFFMTIFVASKKCWLKASKPRVSTIGKDEHMDFRPVFARFVHWIFLSYVSWTIFESFWLALSKPVFTWDSLATSIYAAKVFYFNKNLELLPLLPHASFPLQIPLSAFWMNTILGEWNDQVFKIFFPLIFVCIIVTNYNFIKIFANSFWAKLATLFLLSSNFLVYHATIAYRDLWMQFYIIVSLAFLFFWLKDRQKSYLLLASLFAGFATFVKLEGLAYAFIIFIIFLLAMAYSHEKFKTKITFFIFFVVPAVAYCSMYNLYKFFHGIPLNEKATFDFQSFSLEKIFLTLKRFSQEIFFSQNWSIVYLAMLFSLLINYKTINKNIYVKLLGYALLFFFGLHFMMATCTLESQSMLSPDTLSRVFLHFYPLSIWLIVFLNVKDKTILNSYESN